MKYVSTIITVVSSCGSFPLPPFVFIIAAITTTLFFNNQLLRMPAPPSSSNLAAKVGVSSHCHSSLHQRASNVGPGINRCCSQKVLNAFMKAM
mmetsp:Transcript_9459/g.14945  ORF Transcript_9459/g.14945 Transcript_9459/m.14945 type:complete len:93 (+) Transcript_9459:284-562(+)